MVLLTLILIALWIALSLFARRVLNNPRGDVNTGLFMVLLQSYVRFFHRVTYEGLEHLPTGGADGERVGPLVIVSNHGAGIDPLLIQAIAPFEVKFMMAADMQHPALNTLWEWSGVIAVNRDGSDSASARAAMRYLKERGTIGIFPEGRIVREPKSLASFLPGLGLLIRKTNARVIPVTIEGTPDASSAFASLWKFSRSRVRFHAPLSYQGTTLDSEGIATDIRSHMLSDTGWSPVDLEQLDENGWRQRTTAAA